MTSDARPLVVHLVYRFDVGGLENGIVNLVNSMPETAYRHAIVALTEVTDFRHRIHRSDVVFVSLRKPPGHGVWIYPRLYALFRQLRPAIVHTRNLGALEAMVPAWLARVPVRIHGEHGRDVGDLDGTSRKHRWLRRLYAPFVHRYITVSRDLAEYLVQSVGVSADRVEPIVNGVDALRFMPAAGGRARIHGCPFDEAKHWIVGTVGRMQHVKHQTSLARAFVQVLAERPDLRDRLRLVLVGDGPLRSECESILREAGVDSLAWLPGERNDVPDVLRGLDAFVLPSRAEGLSNTILEAMATGLPVLATDVGGNRDLVRPGVTGDIVPPDASSALAAVLARWADDPGQALRLGRAGRSLIEERFSLAGMVTAYERSYDHLLSRVAARMAERVA